MRTLFKIGSISGIKIQLHISWLVIALLIAISLASHFRAVNPAWSTSIVWGSAVITSVLFFASILAHEFSHAVVARLQCLPVSAITLFALGGIAQIEEETTDAKSEFWVSIIGPITSAMIGIICLAIAWWNGWTLLAEPLTPLQAMIVWLGYINIGLVIFNCPVIDGNTNLKTFVEDHLELSEDSRFLIKQRGELAGLITLQDVAKVGHRRWPYTVIYDVMKQINQLQTVRPETPITEVLELMEPSSANQLAVMSHGQLAGIISRDHIVRLVMTRAESKLEPDIYGAQRG
jgi:Zn-dependent protease